MKAMQQYINNWIGFVTGGIAGVTKYMLDIHTEDLQRFIGGALAAIIFGFLGKFGADIYLQLKRKIKKH